MDARAAFFHPLVPWPEPCCKAPVWPPWYSPATDTPVLVIAVLLMAIGEMIYAPTISAFVTTRAGRHRRASYQAALSITEDIGTAIGPISGLALAAVTSAATLWTTAAILSALAGTGTSLAAAPGSPEQPDTGLIEARARPARQ